MKIREQVPLAELTTMRLGGKAKFVVEVETETEVAEAFSFAADRNLPFFILGGGANTIGKDEGFDGVIIINRIKGISIVEVESDKVSSGKETAAVFSTTEVETEASAVMSSEKKYLLTAFGGEEWDTVVEVASSKGLTGIEALSKIPGLAGAAPVQNIGAYGQEIADTFVSARVYDIRDGVFKTLYKSDFGFSYRRSILNTTKKNRYFVVSITLKLKTGKMMRPFYNSIEKFIANNAARDFSPRGLREIVSQIRADKLPDPKEKASAGSFFKNVYLTPEEAKAAEAKGLPVYHGHDGFKINSGWLIEQCGLAGKLINGFRINEKAALVLINESAKGYEDLARARAEIRAKVKAKFGFNLEQEPVEIDPTGVIEENKTADGAEELSKAAAVDEDSRRG